MRVLFINTSCGVGSTGRICGELSEKLENEGNECVIAYGRSCSEKYSKYGHRIGNKLSVYIDILTTRVFDFHGLSSIIATKRFLKWADEYNPDLLWLHNIHGYFINYELLFRWIKSRPGMKIKWTLHDCWAFTGHCGFFTMAGCEKWKTGCGTCPLKLDYPESLIFDNSRNNFKRKKEAFCGVKDLTIITPSQWLADLVKTSYLKDYPVDVRYNDINKEVFKPTKSDFRQKYELEGKTLILGVANVWHKRKGLDDFIELARMLNDDYCIVLVGFTSKQISSFEKYAPQIIKRTEKQEVYLITGGLRPSGEEAKVVKKTSNGVAIAPDVSGLANEITKGKHIQSSGSKMILITKTDSPEELAGLYSTADFFVNPTHEDNYPTTNLEAQACGTYVITYDVGGSKETLK